MNLYHVRHVDEDYVNYPFFFADSPDEAVQKASEDEWAHEYVTKQAIEDGDILVTEIDIIAKEVRYIYWTGEEWETDTTNPIT